MMVELGVRYRVGPGGVQITWSDGSTSSLRPGTRLMFKVRPQRIQGRLYLVNLLPGASHHYEAPALKPSPS